MSGIEHTPVRAERGDALLIVHVQNDFVRGGKLAVPAGEQVIPPINRLIGLFESRNLSIVATRDWHPANHCSFHAQGGPWPTHCVAGSSGAEFAPGLALPASAAIISSATRPEREAYSGFDGTTLHETLQDRRVRRLFVVGLATEYCVLNTVKDARRLGYPIFLLTDAIRAIDVHPNDGREAIAEMQHLGTIAIETEQVL